MTAISRRNFVSLVGAGAALGPLAALHSRIALGAPSFGPGFGPLQSKLPLNTAELFNDVIGDLRNLPILAVPEGFDYWVVSNTGDRMSDGNRVPGAHDGMAAFRGPRATTVLVRNHELNTDGSGGIATRTADGSSYDATKFGGCTTVVLDNRGRVESHYGSIAGTERNCAGGPTPWQSWLTCEETFATGSSGLRHGYVFDVPSSGIAAPAPIKGMGRFSHEAAAVDPNTGYVYLTEDRGDSLLYRFQPNEYGNLLSGGVLEALRLRDFAGGVNTGSGFRQYLHQMLQADWVRIEQPDPASESGGASTRAQGQSQGAARFVRGEGAWWGNGKVYFVSTGGGDDGGGQVFAYDPASESLTLFVESIRDPNDPALADNNGFVLAAPDNVTVGPDGRLYLCEDGSGVEKVVGVNHDGELYEVARNTLNSSEFAGSCFSHNGRFFFVNLQSPGLTCVIEGPWRKGQR
jgi:uncharacterized protein